MSEPDNISTGIVRESLREQPQPTIDELLKYIDRIDPAMPDYCKADNKAIRAILERHRALPPVMGMVMQEVALEAIRAFVERVEKRGQEYDRTQLYDPWENAIKDELAAMQGRDEQ